MKEYVMMSLETHLFFARIMREHALFLLAAFPAGEMGYRNKADGFRARFEHALEQAVRLSDGMVGEDVLRSGEVFTEFTEIAERQTRRLTKIPIDVRITQAEKNLRAGRKIRPSEKMIQQVKQLNQQILSLLKRCGRNYGMQHTLGDPAFACRPCASGSEPLSSNSEK